MASDVAMVNKDFREAGTVRDFYGDLVTVCVSPDGDVLMSITYCPGDPDDGPRPLSAVLDPEARDKLRELLDRAAMPGQAGAAGIRPGYLACAHCGGEIAPCKGSALPVCKGWIHTAYAATKPVGAHYCEGRNINPSAEPAPDGIARAETGL